MSTQRGFSPILIIIVFVLAIGGFLIYQEFSKPWGISTNAEEYDAQIRNDIREIGLIVEIYYADKQMYPDSLDDLKVIPDLSEFKMPNHPKGKVYTYTKTETGYTITGELTSGELYTYQPPK